jgi:hypothetical protein
MTKKITKAVFGSGHPCGFNLLRRFTLAGTRASAENGFCRMSYFVSHQIYEGGIDK